MGAEGFTLQTPNGSSCVGRISAVPNGITVCFMDCHFFLYPLKNVKLKMSNKHLNTAN